MSKAYKCDISGDYMDERFNGGKYSAVQFTSTIKGVGVTGTADIYISLNVAESSSYFLPNTSKYDFSETTNKQLLLDAAKALVVKLEEK